MEFLKNLFTTESVASTLIFLCMAAFIGVLIGKVQVAKIKNMYLQDMRREYSFDMDLFPSVNCVPTASGMQASIGVTLAMTF